MNGVVNDIDSINSDMTDQIRTLKDNHLDEDADSVIETPPRYGTPSGLISSAVLDNQGEASSSSCKTIDVPSSNPSIANELPTPTGVETPIAPYTVTLPSPTPYVHSLTLQRADGRPEPLNPLLRYQPPYWWPYRTNVKQRWIGRGILEVVSTEFRDRSVDYYVGVELDGMTERGGSEGWYDVMEMR